MKIKLFFVITMLFAAGLSSKSFPQTATKTKAVAYLDSVKIYYGDSCFIGVSSSLMRGLYKYRRFKLVSDYIDQYEKVRQEIISYREQSIKEINNDAAILLDMDRIFKKPKEMNIINACGFYYGPDSVSSLIVSYSIVRNAVKDFYINVLQIASFDNTYKKEIEAQGKDWYDSAKLPEIKDVPFVRKSHRAPVN